MSETTPSISPREERRRRLMRRNHSVSHDLYASLQLHHLWRTLAWEDLRQRYRRSTLGIAWILLSFILMLLIFVLIFGRSSPSMTRIQYTLYLSSGLVVWNFMSGAVTRGVSVFGANGGWIRSTPAPFSVLIFRSIFSNIMETGLTFLAILPLIYIYGVPGVTGFLTMGVAVLLYITASIPMGMLMGCIGARSADFQQLVPALMRIGFFATPVFWDYETRTGTRLMMAHYNPFTHFLELFRAPLRGKAPTDTNWMVAIGSTILLWVAGLIVFKLFRPRLAAWV